jgi:hypothetical protein
VQLGGSAEAQASLGMTAQVHGYAVHEAAGQRRPGKRSRDELTQLEGYGCGMLGLLSAEEARQVMPYMMCAAARGHDDGVERRRGAHPIVGGRPCGGHDAGVEHRLAAARGVKGETHVTAQPAEQRERGPRRLRAELVNVARDSERNAHIRLKGSAAGVSSPRRA